jgi:ATP-dependent Lhr-like helicase
MTQQDIQGLVEKEVKPVWFSKFSECLPKSLAQKTLCEKGMDIQGLVRELTSVSIIY